MNVDYQSDFPVTDAACQAATGKTLQAWFQELEGHPEWNRKRRDAIQWLYDQTGRGADVWWPTTIWVAYEKMLGIVNKKDGLAEGFNICSTKTIAAAVPEVYAAWADAKSLGKWFGSDVNADVQDGGAWSDGDGNSGTFLRVRKDKDLRFTWNGNASHPPTQVDVAFADKGKGKTGITLTHQRIQDRSEADGLRNAWAQSLTRLKELLEG